MVGWSPYGGMTAHAWGGKETVAMSDDDPSLWERYNAHQVGRDVRPLLVEALAHAGPGQGRVAVDIGCGAGIETQWLLNAGWTVYSLDADERSLSLLKNAAAAATRSRAHTLVADLNDLPSLPSADLVYSGYALPFTDPACFHQMWRTVEDSLAPGAVLAVNLFGDRDSWADTGPGTFLTETEARALLDGLQLLHFHVQDDDGMAFSGPKHWHVFDVIARRPAA